MSVQLIVFGVLSLAVLGSAVAVIASARPGRAAAWAGVCATAATVLLASLATPYSASVVLLALGGGVPVIALVVAASSAPRDRVGGAWRTGALALAVAATAAGAAALAILEMPSAAFTKAAVPMPDLAGAVVANRPVAVILVALLLVAVLAGASSDAGEDA